MTDDVALAPFSADAGMAALRVACEQVGLDSTGAELLRLGQNALFTLADGRTVVRVARSVELVERVTREVNTARWLSEADFPAAQLANDVPQVIEAAGRLVTFWQRVENTGEAATTSDLGRILRDLHALPEPAFPLETFDPLVAIPERLAKARAVDDGDLAFMAELAERVGRQYRDLSLGASVGFIHGDAHRNNLIVTPAGVLLSDFDWVARGPHEWDLTPTALAAERFGLSGEEYASFVGAYGRDVVAWEGYPTLRAVREVTMTTWLMQNVAESPDIADEFRLRVRCLREGDHDQRWRAF